MDITTLSNLKFNNKTKLYNLYYPNLLYLRTADLYRYEVKRDEEMRIDSVMTSVYSDQYSMNDVDIILFINGITNPLSIKEGDILYFPPMAALSSYRYVFNIESSGERVREKLAVPNKTTKKDSNRKKFTDNGYSLPPVVLEATKPPVKLEDGKIIIGGLN